MTEQINIMGWTLSADDQVALINGINGLRNQLANPATDMGLLLAGAEEVLKKFGQSFDPLVLNGSLNIVGKAGVILGVGQLANAIGDLKAGKSVGDVYGDLATSLSGIVGSTGLMMEAYAGILAAEGNKIGAESVLKFAKPMNQLGMAFTVGTTIGTIAYKIMPDDIKDAIGGTLVEMESMVQSSIDEFAGISVSPSLPTISISFSGDWAIKNFGNGITQKVLINPSGDGSVTDPNVPVLPEVPVIASPLNPLIAGTWTIPGSNGSVTEIGASADNKYFTIEQKSSNAPDATVLARGDITIDAGGVHNRTFTQNGWTTVTTDPATKQVISNSTAVMQPDDSMLETVTYSNGRVVRITTDTNGNTTQEVVPTAMESFVSATATLIDALTLIKSIQSGDPLPVTVSGLRLVNDINALNGGAPNYTLSGAANVGGGILSLMSLEAALKRGDTLGAVTAGAQTLSYGIQAYTSFAGGAANVSSSVTDLSTFLNGTPGTPTGAIPYLNLVNSIAHGDEVGTAMAVISMTPAAPIAYAYYAFQLVSSLFGGDDAPPEAWGNANATWSGFNAAANATGAYGGLETASQTYNGVLSYLDQLVANEQALNPGSPIGIVANRMPSLSYRNYTGYGITDIDPLTGEQRNPGVLYDLTGRPYNAPAGSVQASQSLSERMIRVALERGAVAPLWEVQTAALQTQMGDPMAGLTEEERAGRAGLLAPSPLTPLPGGEGNQTFRPVALDLNGDGVQTTGTSKTAAFNVDDSGYLKNTAWLDNSDGFLFLDRNLNGQIDGGSELFSNAAVALSERGLAGMRWIDSNYDGSLSALDPVWGELKVWQDANGNGTSDAGEVKTLAQLGITALNYAMGTFERNGQVSELSSPDLVADTEGTITYTVPEGIIVQTSQGQISLLATRIDDRSAIQANRDGVTGYEDTELIVSAADLLANDTLAGMSGNNLSITGVSGFTHGSGFLDGNGFVHYTPDADYYGAAQFNYSIKAVTGQRGAANDGEWFGERRAA